MIRAVPAFLLAIILYFSLVGCGSYNSNPSGSGSGLKNRAFVSNDQNGLLHVIDTSQDTNSGFAVSVGGRPHVMHLSQDSKFTLVDDVASDGLVVVDNATEQIVGRVVLPDVSESFFLLSDDKTGFAAIRNANAVEVLNLSAFNITSTITIPLPLRMALSHDGKKLLVFSDESDSITIVDTAAATASAPIPGFSRPVFGVFSSDDSRAYVLNCGPECGGAAAAASISVMDMTANPPAISGTITVSAATVGVLNGSTLFVAGTPPGAACSGGTAATTCGRLDVVDVSTNSVTTSGLVITDGYHDHMELGSNNQLFIGAHTCTTISTANETRGCLSIYDASGNKVVIPPDKSDVTGIAPISNRNVVYVVQNGELRIYDTTTDALQATQVDIVGLAFDVKEIP